jgi:hypothetical protein
MLTATIRGTISSPECVALYDILAAFLNGALAVFLEGTLAG